MKSTYVDVLNLRRMAFVEISNMAYEDLDLNTLYEETFKMLPGEEAKYRDNIFHERAVLLERFRMALGLDPHTASDAGPITEGVEAANVDTNIYSPPLVDVIKIACNSCEPHHVKITDNCRTCIAHPCQSVCPKNAISLDKEKGQMVIDHDKCIKCKKCLNECPYNAIIETGRPCSIACGMDAFETDELGRAEINHDKCVSCGACMSACPFGAIADKSQIYQLIKSIKHGNDVVGIVAPSFAGQFGPLVKEEQVKEAIKRLGFKDVVEVGLGADLTTMNEAKEFVEEVPEKIPYMATSCCFSWKQMIDLLFEDQEHLVSDTSTPMMYTAEQIKKKNPDAKVVFIGPCVSKKLEALQEGVRDDVDFVITYEELMGMMISRDIEPSEIEIEGLEEMEDASLTARNYAYEGGVAEAVVARAMELNPDLDIKVENASGLHDCIKLMRLAKAGQKDGMLLEGMACQHGCVGGPGTVVPFNTAKKAVKNFSAESPFKSPAENTNIPKEDMPK